MQNHFDELAKTLARGVTRRGALRSIGGGLAAGVLAALGLSKARGDSPSSACQDHCAACYPPPRGRDAQNAYGQCVSGCEQCVHSGGEVCGCTPNCCDPETEVCNDSGECVNPNTCDNPTACVNFCGGGDCGCFPTTEGGSFCGQGIFCDEAQPCTTSADCPSGYACTETCCGGLICEPPCNGAAAPMFADGRLTSIG